MHKPSDEFTEAEKQEWASFMADSNLLFKTPAGLKYARKLLKMSRFFDEDYATSPSTREYYSGMRDLVKVMLIKLVERETLLEILRKE
jgi:hypothetical protein